MTYNYHEELVPLLMPENMGKLLMSALHLLEATEKTGAITYGKAMNYLLFSDSFQMLACLDWLVEEKIFWRIADPSTRTQDWVLVRKEKL